MKTTFLPSLITGIVGLALGFGIASAAKPIQLHGRPAVEEVMVRFDAMTSNPSAVFNAYAQDGWTFKGTAGGGQGLFYVVLQRAKR